MIDECPSYCRLVTRLMIIIVPAELVTMIDECPSYCRLVTRLMIIIVVKPATSPAR